MPQRITLIPVLTPLAFLPTLSDPFPLLQASLKKISVNSLKKNPTLTLPPTPTLTPILPVILPATLTPTVNLKMMSLMEIAALTAVAVVDAVEKVAVDVVEKVAVVVEKAVVKKAAEEKEAKEAKAALMDQALTVPDLMDLTANVAAQADANVAALRCSTASTSE